VILKNFFIYLQKHFYTDIDFKSRLEHLTLKLPQKEPTALNASEYETVMAYFLKETNKRKRMFHSYRNLFMLKVILLCGVRVSECLNIKVEDITVLPSKEELPSIYKIHLLGKGNKERYAYIPQEMIEKELLFLQDYIQEHHLSSSSLCITKEGRVLGRSEVYAMVESFLKNRKIPKRGVHMLRHSFGKHMVSKNINLSTIKALMGHENIQTTLIYARSDEESMIRAVV
jgi:integrase/recombinase XerD